MSAISAEPDSVYAIILCYGQGDSARQVMHDDPRLSIGMNRRSAHAHNDEPASPSLTRRMPSAPQQHPVFLPDPSSSGINIDTPLPLHEDGTNTEYSPYDDDGAEGPLAEESPRAMGGPLGETATPEAPCRHNPSPDVEATGQQFGFTPQGNASAALFAQERLAHGQNVLPHFVSSDFDEEQPLAAPAQAGIPANEPAPANGHPHVEAHVHRHGADQHAQHAWGDDASDGHDVQDGSDVAQDAAPRHPPAYAVAQEEPDVAANTAHGQDGAHGVPGLNTDDASPAIPGEDAQSARDALEQSGTRSRGNDANMTGASVVPVMLELQTEGGAEALRWIYDRFSLQEPQRNLDTALLRAVRRLRWADDRLGEQAPVSSTHDSGALDVNPNINEKRARGRELIRGFIHSLKRKSFKKEWSSKEFILGGSISFHRQRPSQASRT